jgi:hypothetical protein
MSAKIDVLIVRNLKDIESASKIIIDEIQKNVGKAIDDIVGEWSLEKDWFSDGGKFDGENLMLAPKDWKVPESSEKDEFFGSFYFDAINAAQNEEGWENEFWLTQLCNLGVGPVGIRWSCAYSNFNATKGGWKKFLEGRISNIQKRGFNYHQKSGTFFLPFIIDQEALAVAIEGDNIEDALGPLREALTVIEKAQPDFDTLIEDARKHFIAQK